MSEPLKNHFGPAIPKKIADAISAVYPAFNSKAFMADALNGYEELELTPRGWHIAHALGKHLPPDYKKAIKIIVASLGPKLAGTDKFGMAPFMYLPHTCFVAHYGADHFEESMLAQYELTQRFSAEASIRVFIERYPERSLLRLREWASDPSPHVRRLVSEGTRPRLPWAARLRAFQKDPTPVLALLELLKDDPDLYVRRSVANNLNDIGKDQPDILVATAKRWMKNATPERRWVVTHALRSAVKRGDVGALGVLGFGGKGRVAVKRVQISPKNTRIGGSVSFSFDVVNEAPGKQRLLIDYRVHFMKANGKTAPKVFKLTTLDLNGKAVASVSGKVSLRQMTTRKHYKGVHKIDALINGEPFPLGKFEIMD